MIDPVVKLNFDEVKKANGRLSRAAKDLRPVFRPGAKIWRADLREALKAQEGPEGKHPPLSAATLEMRRAQKSSPRGKKWKRKLARGMLGKLWAPLVAAYSKERLRVFSKVDWAGAHQTGATVGHGVKLPERTHVYVTAPFLEWVLARINEHIHRAWYARPL